MKKVGCFCLVLLLCGMLCGCSKQAEKPITIQLTNNGAKDVSEIKVSWMLDEKAYGTVEAKAKEGETLGTEDVLTLIVNPEDLPEDADLSLFGIDVFITDAESSREIADVRFVPEFGESYSFELKLQDGIYGVWMVMEE